MIMDTLIDQIKALENPTVVGLDPRPAYIPTFIKKEAFRKYDDICQAMANAICIYNEALIDRLWDIVPAVKPQIALYEQYGAAGIAAYAQTIRYAKAKGMLVIGDVKRSDIASTAQAYADGHLGRVSADGQTTAVFDTDFITLNPYLGHDAITPFIETGRQYDKGLFILVRTSNPGAGDLQDLETPGGKVYEVVGQRVSEWGADTAASSRCGYSAVGAVVGATYPAQARTLREKMPHTFFLVPGYGAQGGSAADAAACFDQNGSGAIVNNARGIIAAYQSAAYKEKYTEEKFAEAAREAAIDMRTALNACLRNNAPRNE